MANAADFAYSHVGGIGKFDVEAVQDGHSRILTVTVSDQGRWRHSDSTEEKRTRGRGIPLMQMLAEDVTIDHSPLGTIVCLRFENVHSRSYGPVVQEVF
jgi:anti-sigma regulatory factor (Ser/Thr protein kinase)